MQLGVQLVYHQPARLPQLNRRMGGSSSTTDLLQLPLADDLALVAETPAGLHLFCQESNPSPLTCKPWFFFLLCSNKDIKRFTKSNYGVSFPMFSKVDVNGASADPLFDYLKSAKGGFLGSKDIKWNVSGALNRRL